MGAMLFAIALGLGGVLLAHPLALDVLKWGGAAMLCWLAWRIATADHTEQAVQAPAGFLGMAAFQWINPKAWLVGVAAIPAFLGGHTVSVLPQAAIFATVFTVVAFPSCLPWLAFGAALQRFFREPRARRLINWVMAALLAGSTIWLAFGGL
jgi:threonine/homoserine/homoserine lactone efflux protein